MLPHSTPLSEVFGGEGGGVGGVKGKKLECFLCLWGKKTKTKTKKKKKEGGGEGREMGIMYCTCNIP